MQIRIEKRHAFIISAVLVLLAGILAVFAYNSNPGVPSTFGHSANELEVSIGGNTYTLQQAITNNLIGGAAPDYDSGWFAVNSTDSHVVENSHNLGVVPKHFQLLQCGKLTAGACSTKVVYPKYASAGGTNPMSVTADTTKFYMDIDSGNQIYDYTESGNPKVLPGDDEPGGAGADGQNRQTGYYRILAWK